MLFKVRKKYTKKVVKRGMAFVWEFAGEWLHVRLTAPTQGWLAVGFNDRNQLANTNLIMGALYPSGKLLVQDRVIVRAGTHRAKVDLGLADRLAKRSGCPESGGTTIAFSIPTAATDEYSYDLLSGQKIHLLLAYSQERPFKHHSFMRTHLYLML